MTHYACLLVTKRPVDIRIIKADVYASKIAENPGYKHENLGDFTSDIEPENLGSVLINRIDPHTKTTIESIFNKKIILTSQAEFNKQNYELNHAYLIKMEEGLRIYLPDKNNIPLNPEFLQVFISEVFKSLNHSKN